MNSATVRRNTGEINTSFCCITSSELLANFKITYNINKRYHIMTLTYVLSDDDALPPERDNGDQSSL